jgi:predicted DNA-binding transcriptional regulator AlpA
MTSQISESLSRALEWPTNRGTDLPNRKLSVREAARFLGLSASTLNKLRLSGYGCPYLKLGRRVVYDLRDLEDWAARQKRLNTSQEIGQ